MIDAPVLAARFDAALRLRGIDAGTRRARTFVDVLRALPPHSMLDLYWRARVAMLPSIDDLDAFHAAFLAFFGSLNDDALGELAPAVESPPPGERLRRETLPPGPSDLAADEETAERAPTQWVVASSDEHLWERSFDEMDENERRAMAQLMSRIRLARDERRTRRRRPDPHGDRFDFRGTLRGAARSAGELLRRRTTERRLKPRPLIFLLDVSGSMEPYARALVQYARVTARARPRVRAFVFATRLTDLTPLLKRTRDEHLMSAIASAVHDYGGGTRIGAALRTFNDDYAQRGAARGGTVVILSDGWERDDPHQLAVEMERLRRLTRRIVWVNPHKRHPAYEPLVRGMAAALPHVDAFLAGHNMHTLEAVAAAIEGV